MKCQPIFLLTLSLMSSVAFSAPQEKDILLFSVRLSSQESSNALRAHDNPIQERQDIMALTLNANLQNEWAQFTSRYDAGRWKFAENSMPDYTQIEGRSLLNLGAANSPIGLSAGHSRHSTLVSPDAVNISSNRDERTILNAQPWVNWRADRNDDLRLTGIYSKVDYQKSQEKNLTEKGGSIAWVHQSSKVDTYGISMISTKNEYEFSTNSDYKYQALLANYSAKLSHLSYSLAVGENRAQMIQQDVEVSGPMYKFELNHQTASNDVGVYLGQLVTNTSNGNGNRDGLVSMAPDATESAKDLIRSREAELVWTLKSLCSLCRVRLGGALLENDYHLLPADETQRRAFAQFGYQWSRFLATNVSYGKSKHAFDPTSTRADYSEIMSEVSIDYQLAKLSALKLFARKETRDSAVELQNYVERIVGVSLVVDF